MELSVISEYISEYGIIFLFIIVFLEYLNLPGFPAGIILPVAGIWAYTSKVNFIFALLISVIAGLIGSWVLYLIGLYGGDFILKKYTDKFPRHKDYIEQKLQYLRDKGYMGVFISKLIPMARTLISIPAGVLKMDFVKYSLYSSLGILIWNGVFMGAGYIFGEGILKYLV